MNKTITVKFNLGDEVFHITPESPKGYILDISYSFSKDRCIYLVTWGPSLESWCVDSELIEHKNYD